MKAKAVELPPEEDLGPAMKALDERRRRFVVALLRTMGKNLAACARAAGYGDKSEAAGVRANELLRQPKVIKAINEEAERTLNVTGAFAILGLRDLVNHKDPKVRQVAIDSVLDRTGYSRKTTQDIRVEHVDGRSTAQILAELQRLMPGRALPVIDVTAEEVTDAPAQG